MGVPISSLPVSATLTGTESLPVVQSGTTKKTTVVDVLAALPSNAITTAKIADANVTPAKLANSGYELGMRNRIINGAMRIDQRSYGAAVSVSSSTYTLDRWWTYRPGVATGVFSVQSDGSITHPDGFTDAAKITITTADGSLSGSDEYLFMQYVEGVNSADLKFGTPGAKTITVSFWVYCSRPGTYGLSIKNGTNDRSYPTSYVVNAANTWEYKSITIPGCTTGTWDKNVGAGLALVFCLGTATSFKTTGGAWANGNYNCTTGSEDLISTGGATIYFTGVQLESGSVATPFENRPYGLEMLLCQRYFFKTDGVATGSDVPGGAVSRIHITHPAIMRATPTVTLGAGSRANIDTSNGKTNSRFYYTTTPVEIGSGTSFSAEI